MADARARLPDAPRRLSAGLLDRLACDHLVDRLAPAVAPPLVAELAEARRAAALEGSDPGDRFERFVDELADPAVARRRLERYPDLPGRLEAMAGDWVDFMAELLERIEADWPLLTAGMEGADPADVRVTAVEELGDRHGGGRCVAAVTLEAGDEGGAGSTGNGPDPGPAGGAAERARWVYKPRDVGAERAFGRLLAWLEPDLPVEHLLPRVAAREGYGWMSHVPHRPCADEAEVAAFYRRLGSLTAVLHLLLARDLHAENVVACGAHPVVVDLEGVMPPRFAFHRRPGDGPRAHLLRSLLLPGRIAVPGGWTDPTAVGGVEGPGGPLRRRWRRAGTDRMEPVWRPIPPGPATNRPTLDGRPVEPLGREDDFLDGFRDAFRAVAARRDALAGAESPLRAFRDVDQRVALRGTARYAFLLERSWAASAWRRVDGRRAVFDVLDEEHSREGVADLVAPHERAALLAGDVPLFRTRCGETGVRTGRGASVALEASASGLDEVLRHLERDFGPEGLAVQTTVIRQAFEARRRNRGSEAPGGAGPEGGPDGEPRAASAAGAPLERWLHDRLDRLLELRIGRGRRTAWPTLVESDAGWRAGLTDRSLARGVSGIGWVLFHAGRCLERPDCTRAARACLRRLEAGLDDPGAEPVADPGPGLLEGSAGWLRFVEAWLRHHDDGAVRELGARIRERRGSVAGTGDPATAAPADADPADAAADPADAAAAGAPPNATGPGGGAFGRPALEDGVVAGEAGVPERARIREPFLVAGLLGGEAGRIHAALRRLFLELVPRPAWEA